MLKKVFYLVILISAPRSFAMVQQKIEGTTLETSTLLAPSTKDTVQEDESNTHVLASEEPLQHDVLDKSHAVRNSVLSAPLVVMGLSLAGIIAYKIWASKKEEALLEDAYYKFIVIGLIPTDVRSHISFFAQYLNDSPKKNELIALTKFMNRVQDAMALKWVTYLLKIKLASEDQQVLSPSYFRSMRNDFKRYKRLLEEKLSVDQEKHQYIPVEKSTTQTKPYTEPQRILTSGDDDEEAEL